MAEEEKGDEAQSQSDIGSSDAEKTAESTEKDQATITDNWEQKFKDAQAEITQLSQGKAELQEQIETITPYVDFGRARGEQPQSIEESDEERYISEKDAQRMVSSIRQEVAGKLIASEFRSKNPDLIDYEKSIVTPAVIRLTQQHPTWMPDKLLKEAVTFTRDLLEKERTKGKDEATVESEQKQKAAGAAAGLGSAGVTSPKKEEKKGETAQEYISWRKEQSRKSRGLI